MYVPVPAEDRYEDPLMDRYYAENIATALKRFSTKNLCHIDLREGLANESAHLDPDFCANRLSYGDSGNNNKGIALRKLAPGDFVIFYNCMCPIKPLETGDRLEYGIIGILRVSEIYPYIGNMADERNIHSRRPHREPTDVVAFGAPERSGRFEKYLPIGVFEKRNKKSKYYVRASLANEWDGVSNNGYIQMSFPVWLDNPERFFEWFNRQNLRLIQENNP